MTRHIEYEKNGFDLLRYAAALSVMVLHYSGYAMILSEDLGILGAAVMDRARQTALLFPGVVILFAMSGFLVSASRERAKRAGEFYRRRVLRMYPELWLCTAVNLAVIFALVPELPDASVLLWLGTQVFGIANTPACLKSFATGSVNGALWTIFTEVQLYLILGIVYPLLRKMKNFHWFFFLAALAAANVGCGLVSGRIGGAAAKLIERSALPYALWFFIGVYCFQKRQQVLPVLRRAFFPLLVLYLVIESGGMEIPGYYADIVTGILLPFMVIGCGYCLPAIRLKADLTYGMFLYHWIVLNIMVHFDLMNRWPWYAGAGLFLAGTMLAAALSRRVVRCLLRYFSIFFKKHLHLG